MKRSEAPERPDDGRRRRRYRPSKRRILLFQSVVTAVLVPLLLLLGEGAVRVLVRDVNFLGTSRELFVMNAYGESHGNAPNVEALVYGVQVTIDRNGFRMDPHAPPNSSAGDRDAVVIVGDSVTFGPGVPDGATFPDLLRARLGGRPVYNAGIIGWGIADYLNFTEAALVPERDRLGVRSVVLCICLNDISRRSKAMIVALGRNPEEKKVYSKPVEWLRKRTTSINAFLRTRSKLFLFVKGLLVDSSQRYFLADAADYEDPAEVDLLLKPLETVAALLREADVALTVVLLPYEYQLRTQDEAHLLPQRRIGAFLRAAGIRFIDAYPEFVADMNERGRESDDYFAFNDPMHFNALGHRVTSDVLVDRWEQLDRPASP